MVEPSDNRHDCARNKRFASAAVATTFGLAGEAAAGVVDVRFEGSIFPTLYDLTNVRLIYGSNFSFTPELIFTLPDASAGVTTQYSFEFSIDESLLFPVTPQNGPSWEITGTADVTSASPTGDGSNIGWTHTVNPSFNSTVQNTTHTTDHLTVYHGGEILSDNGLIGISLQPGNTLRHSDFYGSATSTSFLENWYVGHPYLRYPVEWDVNTPFESYPGAGFPSRDLTVNDFEFGRYSLYGSDGVESPGDSQTLITFVDGTITLSTWDRSSPLPSDSSDLTGFQSFQRNVAIAELNGSAEFNFTVIPEPGVTGLLIGLGVLAAVWAKRKWLAK